MTCWAVPGDRKARGGRATARDGAEAAFRAGMRDGRRLQSLLAEEVCREPLARLQYAAVVDPDTLEPMAILGARALFALAVMVGGTRLIDNLLVEVS